MVYNTGHVTKATGGRHFFRITCAVYRVPFNGNNPQDARDSGTRFILHR